MCNEHLSGMFLEVSVGIEWKNLLKHLAQCLAHTSTHDVSSYFYHPSYSPPLAGLCKVAPFLLLPNSAVVSEKLQLGVEAVVSSQTWVFSALQIH